MVANKSIFFVAIDQRIINTKIAIAKMRSVRYRIAPFIYKPFSKKQKQVLTWWMDESPVKGKDGIIADGAIRSGKTLSMSLSFGLWAMSRFSGQNFLICGKTIGSLRRNVVFDFKRQMQAHGYKIHDIRSDNLLIISKAGITNRFHLFGGKDERSQDLVQGITAAGVLFDEVVLQPESFVNQATGRCSITGSKFWFNCNPEGPFHWFKVNWIDRVPGVKQDAVFDDENPPKNLHYIHFTMDDNLSLSEEIKARYRSVYSGVFFQRFIMGLWVQAQGIVYTMFNHAQHVIPENKMPHNSRTKKQISQKVMPYEAYYISCDYGTKNPCVFILWGLLGGVYYAIDEYYYDGRKLTPRTDEEHYAALEQLAGRRKIKRIIIDPSAASFITLIQRSKKFPVHPADNAVIDGIRECATALKSGILKFSSRCVHTIDEFGLYLWDERKQQDEVIKENDHAMDAVRYLVKTLRIAVLKRSA